MCNDPRLYASREEHIRPFRTVGRERFRSKCHLELNERLYIGHLFTERICLNIRLVYKIMQLAHHTLLDLDQGCSGSRGRGGLNVASWM